VFEDTPEHRLFRTRRAGNRSPQLTGVEVNEKYAVVRPEDWTELEELARRKRRLTLVKKLSRRFMGRFETLTPPGASTR